MLWPLPELPEVSDPLAPSAPPETDLRDVDPEQAEFAALLKRTYQRCLQVSGVYGISASRRCLVVLCIMYALELLVHMHVLIYR